MPVSFNNVPADLRVPLFYAEMDNSAANSASSAMRRLIVAVLVALGYSGWSAGQLEHEIAQNAWLTVPASLDIVFSPPPEERLAAAMQLLGVDFAKLSDVAGHA